MAGLIHQAGLSAIYSYAGVTQSPKAVVLPTRIGGFGGVGGLCHFLREQEITHVVDATHPFAAQMSAHAIEACEILGIPLLSLERPQWQRHTDDIWIDVPDMAAAAAALPQAPSRVFLAIGRKQLAAFASQTKHDYLLRVIDAPEQLPLARHTCVVARGPFDLSDEIDLLRLHRIQCMVSKNAGGTDTYAKIEAARMLQLPVIMVRRPNLPEREQCETPQQALAWLLARGAEPAKRH